MQVVRSDSPVLQGHVHPAAVVSALGHELAELLPNAEFAVVPDAGHVANLDDAEASTSLVRDFLDRD